MSWRTAHSIDDLKKLGPFRTIQGQVKREVEALQFVPGLKFQCTPNSWEKLFHIIQRFLAVENFLHNVSTQETDPYFRSPKHRFIFSLLELDGENRNRHLGIGDEECRNKAAAKLWMKDIARKIHPDKNHADPLAEEATQQLNEIYELLTE